MLRLEGVNLILPLMGGEKTLDGLAFLELEDGLFLDVM